MAARIDQLPTAGSATDPGRRPILGSTFDRRTGGAGARASRTGRRRACGRDQLGDLVTIDDEQRAIPTRSRPRRRLRGPVGQASQGGASSRRRRDRRLGRRCAGRRIGSRRWHFMPPVPAIASRVVVWNRQGRRCGDGEGRDGGRRAPAAPTWLRRPARDSRRPRHRDADLLPAGTAAERAGHPESALDAFAAARARLAGQADRARIAVDRARVLDVPRALPRGPRHDRPCAARHATTRIVRGHLVLARATDSELPRAMA